MNFARTQSDMESGRVRTNPRATNTTSATAQNATSPPSYLESNRNQIFTANNITKEMLQKLQNADLNNNKTFVLCGFKFNACRISVLIALITLFLASAATAHLFWDTQWFRNQILQKMVISNTSDGYKNWVGPAKSRVRLYIYNYTNAENVARGLESKLRVEELGPYTYEEVVKQENVHFSPDGARVSYQQHHSYKFLEEESRGRRQNDQVVVPNIPMLAAAAMSKKSYYLTRLGMSALFRHLHAEPFIKLAADRFIFGYDDELFNLAKGVLALSKPLPFEKFGLLASRAGLSDDVMEISTGKEDIATIGQVTSFNGAKYLDKWINEDCDRVGGVDGFVMPPLLVKERRPFELFWKDVCRKMPMTFEKQTRIYNNVLPSHRYVIAENAFGHPSVNNPQNQGYCDEDGQCPPHGLFNMSKCSFGTPLFLSMPHFMGAEPTLREAVDGVSEPNVALHQSYFDVHPFAGIVEQGWIRMQTNIHVQKSAGMTELGMFEEDMFLPIAWMEFGLNVEQHPAEILDILNDLTYTVDGFELAVKWGSLLMMLVTAMGMVAVLRAAKL